MLLWWKPIPKYTTLNEAIKSGKDLWEGIDETYKMLIENYFTTMYASRYLSVEIENNNIDEAWEQWHRWFKTKTLLFCEPYLQLKNKMQINEPFTGKTISSTVETNTSHTNENTSNTSNLSESDSTSTNKSQTTNDSSSNTSDNTDTTTNNESNENGRTVTSDYPQSNLGGVGADAEFSWNYATNATDRRDGITQNGSSNTTSETTSDSTSTVDSDATQTNTSSNSTKSDTTANASGTSNTDSTSKTVETVDNFERTRELVKFYMNEFPLKDFLEKFEPLFLSTYKVKEVEEWKWMQS